ncbi:MAG: MATE family efflux transporter [Gemmiger sp.]|uniref:MATE family efflux transporter n=1 Tax=Gemmiger sp. TaxID=2049027 RepID=UPI002E77AD45|nr:MATE family efflux transporter [Gemmiger sp.]MEE0801055.1 MATE family efflux transporter [Gemmiger sp.]
MAATQTENMGTGSVPKLLFNLALPAVVAQIINLLYNIVDRIYIGHIEGIGATALTGVGLCMPILMLVNAFAMLCGSGGAPRAAIAMGQKDDRSAERIMGNCFSLLVILALILTVVFYIFAPPLLVMFGASENTLPYALDYTRIYVLGSLFVMVVLGMNTFVTTQGFATFSMLTTVIGAVCNIVLDPLFIFVFGMGVRGAAIATVISQGVSAVWVLRFLTGKRTRLHLRRAYLRIVPKVILPCLALGVSSFVMIATESILSISFNSSLSRYGGDLAVGAMTIITSVSQLISMPIQGVCQGGQPIISFNFGAGKPDRVKEAFRWQFIACVSYAAVFWALLMLVPHLFVQIFNNDAQLVDYTVWAMRIYMAGIFSTGFQVACQQGFVALGQAKISLLMACLRKLILLIPLIFLLPLVLSDKVFAVFLAEPISDIIAAMVTCTAFFTRFNRILKQGPKKV